MKTALLAKVQTTSETIEKLIEKGKKCANGALYCGLEEKRISGYTNIQSL
jgi:hypothetical protein